MDVRDSLRTLRPFIWTNPDTVPWEIARTDVPLTDRDVAAARARFARHRPLFARLFGGDGNIRSPLREFPAGSATVLAKLDSELPIAGSIKARGGFHEVLQYAESVLTDAGLDPGAVSLDAPQAREILGRHTVAVGSTGNLGLSIGLMARALGFSAVIHMSADARRWKKELLREIGAEVVEYAEDYSVAVERGRTAAAADPFTHFVDDENSRALFLGYAVAGDEVRAQLDEAGVFPTPEQPLTAFLPCGVGGGPGGVCFGLKRAYGDAVRCVFAEPTHSPAMLLGLATGLHHRVSVADIGLDNRTVADGLAVGRPSRFVGQALQRTIDQVVTVSDEDMLYCVDRCAVDWGVRLEPSATAGLAAWFHCGGEGRPGPDLIWTTGGSRLPDDEFSRYRELGRLAEPPDTPARPT